MTPPTLPPSLAVERPLDRSPLGEAWAVRTSDGTAATAVLLARELVALAPDEARLEAALRASVSSAERMAAAPALLPLLDVQLAGDGRPVLVWAREERAPAAARLALGKAFASADVAAAARAIGGALGALHAAGAHHGAIHPGLVYLGGDQPPRLAGAGIVDALVAAGATRAMVLVAMGGGTFAAPELAAAAPDARSDVYALGASLYACLTGKPPFGGRTTAFTMAAVLADEGLSGERHGFPGERDAAALAAQAAATERLTTALLRAVERAPDDRWRTASDLVRALDPRVPTPPEAPATMRTTARKVATRGGCLAMVLLLLAAGGMAAATVAARWSR